MHPGRRKLSVKSSDAADDQHYAPDHGLVPAALVFGEGGAGNVCYLDGQNTVPDEFAGSRRSLAYFKLDAVAEVLVGQHRGTLTALRHAPDYPPEHVFPQPADLDAALMYLRAGRERNDIAVLDGRRGAASGAAMGLFAAMKYCEAARQFKAVPGGFGVIERLVIGHNQIRHLLELGDLTRAGMLLDDLFGPWVYYAGAPVDRKEDFDFATRALQYLDGFLQAART